MSEELKTMSEPVGQPLGLLGRIYLFIVGHPRYRFGKKIEMPDKARAYIFVVALLGVAALVLVEWLDYGEPVRRWWLFAFLALYVVFDHVLQFSLFRGQTYGASLRLEEGLIVALALLYPPWLVILAFLFAGLFSLLVRGTSPIRSLFNNGQLMVAVAAALGVMRLFDVHPWQQLGGRQLAGCLLGALVFFLISNLAVMTVLALVQERSLRKEIVTGLSAWSFWYFFLSSLSLGLLTGIVILYSRWGVIVALAGAGMLIVALRERTRALGEREQLAALLGATRELHETVVVDQVCSKLVEQGRQLLNCEVFQISDVAAAEHGQISSPLAGLMAGKYLLASGKLGSGYWANSDQRLLEALTQIGSAALTNALSFELVQSERGKLEDILDFSSDAILVLAPNGDVVGWNPAMTALSGVEEKEALGHSAIELAARAPSFTALLASSAGALPTELVEVPRERGLQTLSVARSVTPDGSRVVVARDESARLELERVQVERETERLRSDLVSTVSHELRTPLTSIIGFSQFLLQREVPKDDANRYLETIYSEANRLSELLNDFLDLQRIKEGRFLLEIAPFDLGATAAEVVALFSQQSPLHSLHLVAEQALVVSGDRDRIRQVVANLVSNAIKYSPQGGDVVIRASLVDGRGRLEVEDQGLGIPVEARTSLFSKFFRVVDEERKAIGGTGLGLAICKEIVDAHDGRIGFESEPGQGSTFWFELDMADQGTVAGAPR